MFFLYSLLLGAATYLNTMNIKKVITAINTRRNVLVEKNRKWHIDFIQSLAQRLIKWDDKATFSSKEIKHLKTALKMTHTPEEIQKLEASNGS